MSKRKVNLNVFILLVLLMLFALPCCNAGELLWPIDCVPGVSCDKRIGYPDINKTGQAFDCGRAGYKGHEGTDISITMKQMDEGVDVYAAADGTVLWVFDGKYDKCPNLFQPDCRNYLVCTEQGNYCGRGTCCCYWCFAGGNVVVIKHDLPGVFATRYDHFKKNSILVKPGDKVKQGQKIGEVGSAGRSGGPHLHFEVWGSGFYELADPWVGACGPNKYKSLWKYNPPWKPLIK